MRYRDDNGKAQLYTCKGSSEEEVVKCLISSVEVYGDHANLSTRRRS
jgi:hypothetical protein